MSESFQKTVNLKEEFDRQRAAERAAIQPPPIPAKDRPRPEKTAEKNEKQSILPQPKRTAPINERSAAIDQVYKNEIDTAVQPDLQKISRPAQKKLKPYWFKPAIWLVLFIIVGVGGYYLIAHKNRGAAPADKNIEIKWYAVELMSGETYYGQIGDTSADPVVISNVYYNYDQLNPAANTEPEQKPAGDSSGTLRLVKRGQETHGPSGTMDIVRAQVKLMEPLKEDSKVLKAILEYEKQ